MTTIKPISDELVIAQVEESDNKTESGIILPDAAVQRPQYATVIAVSDDHTKVTPGDIILIRKHSGTEITHNGEDYLVLHINEILALTGKA
jgi:chaperonin GroES